MKRTLCYSLPLSPQPIGQKGTLRHPLPNPSPQLTLSQLRLSSPGPTPALVMSVGERRWEKGMRGV